MLFVALYNYSLIINKHCWCLDNLIIKIKRNKRKYSLTESIVVLRANPVILKDRKDSLITSFFGWR